MADAPGDKRGPLIDVGPSDAPEDRWRLAFTQLLELHPAHMALIALDGTVLGVNAAWRRFAQQNGVSPGYQFVGQNYLQICEAAIASGDLGSQQVYLSLLRLARGAQRKFSITLPCHSPVQRRWFRMWAESQMPAIPALIVAHQRVDDPSVGPGDLPSLAPARWPA